MRVLAVTNMLPSKDNPRSGTFVEQQISGLREIGLQVEVVHFDRVNYGMAAYLKVRRRMRDLIARSRPDVVHIMYGGVMAMLAIQVTSGIPIVVAFCGTDLNGEDTGGFSLRLRGHVGVLCSHWVSRKADHIIVKSRSLERRLPDYIDRRYVSIIPNGIDLDRFRPMDRQKCRHQLGWETDCFHILFCTHGPNDTNKRQVLAASAVQALNQNGVYAKLQVMQNTSHNRVPIWLNAADAVILTSVYEGSPNIVKEALACGRPVVSVDVGDVQERIRKIDGCFIAEPNPADLADKLELVKQGRGAVSSREVMQDLSLRHVADRLKDVYQKATDRFGARNNAPPKSLSTECST